MDLNPAQIIKIVGFAGALSTALLGQSDLIGEPWKHWLTIVGIISSVTIAYFQQPPRDPSSRDRRSDNGKPPSSS